MAEGFSEGSSRSQTPAAAHPLSLGDPALQAEGLLSKSWWSIPCLTSAVTYVRGNRKRGESCKVDKGGLRGSMRESPECF